MRDLIEDGRVHVFDGAMGTELYGRGVFVNVCYDKVGLDQPDLVKRIHKDYVDAGAEIIETNTFGANPVKLSSYGLEDRTDDAAYLGLLERHLPAVLDRHRPMRIVPLTPSGRLDG